MSTKTDHTPSKMPVFRVCRLAKYANHPDGVIEPAYYVGDVWFEQFKDKYWRNRAEAAKWLDEAQIKWCADATKGAALIERVDPRLALRIRNHEASQEDCRKPYYNEIRDAVYAIEHWEWGQELVVGECAEPNTICRLNTLLSDPKGAGEAKRRELDEKMEFFGECEILWSCTGHSRAEWQTLADAEWLVANRPGWELEIDGSRLFVRDADHAKVKVA